MWLLLLAWLFCSPLGHAYCPPGCRCNHTELSVACSSSALHIVPITLNPHITQLSLRRSEVKTLDSGLQFYEVLTRLDLSDNQIVAIQDGAFKAQGKLEVLDLSGNKLSHITAGSFAGLHNLTQLYLSRNLLETVEAAGLLALDRLEGLDLSHNRLRSSSLPDLRLKSLSLAANSLTAVPSLKLRSLKRLDLSGNRLRRLDLCQLAHLPLLEELTVAQAQVRQLTKCRKQEVLPRLAKVDVSGNWLSPPIAALLHLTSLRHLVVGQRNLTSLPKGAFSGLGSVTTIDLSNSEILRWLEPGAFLGLPSLRRILLSRTPSLTELPAGFLLPGSKVTHLVARDSSLSRLQKNSLPWHNLQYLDLTGSPLLCDCRLTWLPPAIKTVNVTLAACGTPAGMAGKPVGSLAPADLQCQLLAKPQISLLSATLVVVSLAAATAAFLLWRHRRQRHTVADIKLTDCHQHKLAAGPRDWGSFHQLDPRLCPTLCTATAAHMASQWPDSRSPEGPAAARQWQEQAWWVQPQSLARLAHDLSRDFRQQDPLLAFAQSESLPSFSQHPDLLHPGQSEGHLGDTNNCSYGANFVLDAPCSADKLPLGHSLQQENHCSNYSHYVDHEASSISSPQMAGPSSWSTNSSDSRIYETAQARTKY